MDKVIYRRIADALSVRQMIVLATVMLRSGSAPRDAGAVMAVFENGESLGTVGGGPLEAQVLKTAAEAFQSRRSLCLTYSLTDHMDTKGGMICGGYVEVLLAFLDGDDPVAPVICKKILSAYEKRKSAWIVHSILPGECNERYVRAGMGVIMDDETDAGSLDLSDLEIASLKLKSRPDQATLVETGSSRYLIQPICLPGRIIIAGAGHVGRELAALCGIVGIDTIIIDDRAEYANPQRFPDAGKIVIAPASYEECLHQLSVNHDDGIVIITRGHENDRAVLRQALQSRAGYIGMIGSRRKRDAIYERLLKEGILEQELSRVHCPIGIGIGAETPAEIAVSIVAELIAWRHRQL